MSPRKDSSSCAPALASDVHRSLRPRIGRDHESAAVRCGMKQSAVVRWSSPELILVATNLLEGQSLLLHAIFQARLTKAKVLLVHVIPPSYLKRDLHDGAPCFLPGPAVRAIKASLDEATRQFQQAGVLCEPIVLTGSPAEEISLLVKLRSVDRVIVGTRYASGVARLVEPSVAEELITTLEVPVCIIGRRTHPRTGCGVSLGNVLLAASLHSPRPLLASFASTLAEMNNARLTLLHVLDPNGMDEQQRMMARFVARQKLSAMVPNGARHRCPPEFVVREGDPATVILHEAGYFSQDVLVLGSASSMAPRLLTDSVVRRVIVESQCPVITLRSNRSSDGESADTIATLESAFIHS
jgi:nucleotide-binding universal stress UspA family protein